ncbi:MAG: hypothetical protein M3Z41_05160 [Candidatus Eremiobacteraeota bacterium]|nr:hypothetical protein [Candidatus Eremiobacteraeota bacterium]
MRSRPLIAALLMTVALASCSSKKTVETTQGTTTVETNALHNTVKFSNKQGTAIIGKGAVDAKELGLPLYPGAIAAQTGGMAASTKEGTSRVVSLTTKDSFDQVYQWYKKQLPAGSEQTHMEVSGGSIASFLIGKPSETDERSVLIQQAKDTTTILLTHTSKST